MCDGICRKTLAGSLQRARVRRLMGRVFRPQFYTRSHSLRVHCLCAAVARIMAWTVCVYLTLFAYLINLSMPSTINPSLKRRSTGNCGDYENGCSNQYNDFSAVPSTPKRPRTHYQPLSPTCGRNNATNTGRTDISHASHLHPFWGYHKHNYPSIDIVQDGYDRIHEPVSVSGRRRTQ
jgi:hypothetical protein